MKTTALSIMGTLPYFFVCFFSNIFYKGKQLADVLFAFQEEKELPKCVFFSPIALRKTTIVYNFGLSECKRAEGNNLLFCPDSH